MKHLTWVYCSFVSNLLKEEITMKKLRRTIIADTAIPKPTALSKQAKYSPQDIHDFLLSVEELRGHKITAVENKDGSCEFTIGNTAYSLADDII